jgi:ketosteroid isomerase-like protein
MDAQPPSGARSNMDVLREFETLAMSGRLDEALERCVHPNMEVIEPPCLPHGGRFSGRDGLRRMMEIRRGIWDNTFDEMEYWDAGDVIIAYQVLNATAKSTGRTARFPAVRIHRFRDGKLSSMEVVVDTKAFLDTLEPEM